MSEGLHRALQDGCAYLVAGDYDRLGALFTEDGSLEVASIGCYASGPGVPGAIARAMSTVLCSEVSLYDSTRWGTCAGARGHFVAATTNSRVEFEFTIQVHVDGTGRITRLLIDSGTDQHGSPNGRA